MLAFGSKKLYIMGLKSAIKKAINSSQTKWVAEEITLVRIDDPVLLTDYTMVIKVRVQKRKNK